MPDITKPQFNEYKLHFDNAMNYWTMNTLILLSMNYSTPNLLGQKHSLKHLGHFMKLTMIHYVLRWHYTNICHKCWTIN